MFEDNIERWIGYLAKNPDEHYVSGGDPNTVVFPRYLASHLNAAAAKNKKAQPY